MKERNIFYITIVIALTSFVCLFFFHTDNKTSAWKNYKIIAVEKSVSENQVLQEFSNLKIQNVISLSTQKTSFSEMAPVMPAKFSPFSRNVAKYFTDKNGNYNLYYIPQHTSNAKLKKLSFPLKSVYVRQNCIFTFFVILALYAVLCFFYRDKIKFALVTLPFLPFSFFNATVSNFLCSLFAFLAIFIFSQTEYRRNQKKCALKNPFILAFVAFSVIFSFFSGIKSFFAFVLTLVSCVNIYINFDLSKALLQKKFSKGENFSYKKIVSSEFFPLATSKSIVVLCTSSVLILLSLILYFTLPSSRAKNELCVPVPQKKVGNFTLHSYTKTQKNKNSTSLPDFADFVEEIWYSQTLPYVSLNSIEQIQSPVKKNTKVYSEEYLEIDGKIQKQLFEKATFNNGFIKKAYRLCAKNSTGVESLLKSKKGFFRVEYSDSQSFSAKNIILFSLSLFFSFADILFYFVAKKKKRIF